MLVFFCKLNLRSVRVRGKGSHLREDGKPENGKHYHFGYFFMVAAKRHFLLFGRCLHLVTQDIFSQAGFREEERT